MLQILILVLALCMDTFVASIAYGANKINITWKKVFFMNGICSGCLGAALAVGGIIDNLIPETFTKAVCCTSLLLLGLVKLLDFLIKKFINTHCALRKDISFSFSGLQVIISIYGDPMAADWDRSQSLSWKETAFLALAMSLDSLVAGTLAAFMRVPLGLTVVTAFVMGVMVMYGGMYLGKKLADRCGWDLSWISGCLFIALALSKIWS
ncbi:MAG: manganese efflux pump [Clostridiaceae bacterium]|nr:manganese efflux pump [Clostridiaceae bacterium]